ncbi:hypothetical protein NMY22_g8370 [Coprinellus aureogranulatus]|nr:hypothetical protein NMY22_g8370 [Coprinellus aureogranulatus]
MNNQIVVPNQKLRKYRRFKEDLMSSWLPGLAQAILNNDMERYLEMFARFWVEVFPIRTRASMLPETYLKNLDEAKAEARVEILGRYDKWRFERITQLQSSQPAQVFYDVSSALLVQQPGDINTSSAPIIASETPTADNEGINSTSTPIIASDTSTSMFEPQSANENPPVPQAEHPEVEMEEEPVSETQAHHLPAPISRIPTVCPVRLANTNYFSDLLAYALAEISRLEHEHKAEGCIECYGGTA